MDPEVGITLTANGVSASDFSASATTCVKIVGDLRGGKVSIEASNEDANYGLVMPEEYFPINQSRAQVFYMPFPAGTYFRVTLNGAQGTPSVKVAIW